MIGKVNSFHSFSTSDGPGIRAVIFLQGCPLRCNCCHNPETWDMTKGIEMSSDEVVAKIKKGLTYYKNGGVTCSGGEALMQPKFVQEIFEACHKMNLHTTLDTSGCVISDDVKSLLEHTDLVLLDVKMTTEEKYNVFAKGSLVQTVKFLDYLDQLQKPTWIRHVVIPGVNDSEEEIKELKKILKDLSCIEKVEFLPFRNLCQSKYDELGLEFPYKDIKEANQNDIDRVVKIYNME